MKDKQTELNIAYEKERMIIWRETIVTCINKQVREPDKAADQTLALFDIKFKERCGQ
jgi:hypothetical protein